MSYKSVSIHAPARGAISVQRRRSDAHSFNSRTREGCDSPDTRLTSSVPFQFTHPRGVRWSLVPICQVIRCFNSRTREGCDMFGWSCSSSTKFQFTHPRGVRSLLVYLRFRKIMFQFTHPRGVRFATSLSTPLIKVSIHAPARGAMLQLHYQHH